MTRAIVSLFAGMLIVATVATLGVSGAAFTGQTANPSNSAATLLVQPPSGTSASSVAGGSVNVSWAATPTSPGAGHLLSYLVLRGPLGGPYSQIATVSATALSYTDTPASDGTYSYVVQAQVSGTGAFTSVNSTAATAYSDRTPPIVAVSYPASGGSYTTSTWSGAISGTATDATSGIAAASSICLTITSPAGLTWNGAGFVSGSNCVAASSYDGSTGSWTYAFGVGSFPADGTYAVRAQATDRVGNAGTSATSTFTYATAKRGWTYLAAGAPATRLSSGTMSVPVPSGSTNDLLLLVEVNRANQQITTPAGWTLLADQATGAPSQLRFTVWWKPAGTETSVSLSVNTNSNGTSAWVVRYASPDGTAPVLATASVRQGLAAASTTMTPSPDVTTNAANATVISLASIRAGNTLSLASGSSFTAQVSTTSSIGTGLGVADLLVPTAGSTPASPTWSQSGTPAQWAWATAAFN